MKTLRFTEIRGRREYMVHGKRSRTRYLKLVSNDDRLPSLAFPKLCNFDDEFYEWYNKLPDLDTMDKLKQKSSDFGLV